MRSIKLLFIFLSLFILTTSLVSAYTIFEVDDKLVKEYDFIDTTIKISDDNTLIFEKDDETYFNISYDLSKHDTILSPIKDLVNIDATITDERYVDEKNGIELSIYNIKESVFIDNNILRYINLDYVNSSEMVSNYAVFQYHDSPTTIISYEPTEGYIFYGSGDYERNIRTDIRHNVEIIRYKTEMYHGCPVMVSQRGKDFVIELHKNDLTNDDIDIVFAAIREVLNDNGVIDIKKTPDFIVEGHLIYYMDGLQAKQVGRIASDRNTIIFSMYLNTPDESYLDNMKVEAYIEQNVVTTWGGLRDLNPEIDISIKDDIVEKISELLNYNLIEGSFTTEEEVIKNKIKTSLTNDWKITGIWESPLIEPIENGFEYSLTLDEKPDINNFIFDIDTKGLNFYYQHEDNHIYKNPLVDGSYAVYLKKLNNGRQEKFAHIYRPKIIDAEDNYVYGDINIDVENNILTVTVPQAFLNDAIYPILIDPTFGYTSIGASKTTNEHLQGNVYDGVDGTLNNITFYRGAKYNVNIGLYEYFSANNSITLIETDYSSLVSTDATGWYSLNFSSTLSSSKEYALMFTQSPESDIYYDTVVGSVGLENSTVTHVEIGIVDVATFSGSNTKQFSIYADYTASDTPPTYSDNSTNGTAARKSISHNLKWEDDVGLSGYIFSFDNGTGTFVNDSFVSMTGTLNWSNVTKTITTTSGETVRWCVYANDTSSNINSSSCDTPFNYTTTAEVDANTYAVSYWNTDDSGAPFTDSVSGHSLLDASKSTVSGISSVTGVINKAVHLTGDGSGTTSTDEGYLETADTADYAITGDFLSCSWVKYEASAAYALFGDYYRQSDNDRYGWYAYFGYTNRVISYRHGYGTELQSIFVSADNAVPVYGTMYHACIYSDGYNDVRAYINGVEKTMTRTQGPVSIAYYSGHRKFALNGFDDDSSASKVEGMFNSTYDGVYYGDLTSYTGEPEDIVDFLYASGSPTTLQDYEFGVVKALDTCTCPGLATDWEIDLSDECEITDDCSISTGDITFINDGSVLFNATLTTNDISFKDSSGVFEKYNLGNNFVGNIG